MKSAKSGKKLKAVFPLKSQPANAQAATVVGALLVGEAVQVQETAALRRGGGSHIQGGSGSPPPAALIRAVIKSCANWCGGQHWPLTSLRGSATISPPAFPKPNGPEERGRCEAATPAGRVEREGERERQTDGGTEGQREEKEARSRVSESTQY